MAAFAIVASNTVAMGNTVPSPSPTDSPNWMTQMNLMLLVLAPVVVFFLVTLTFRKLNKRGQGNSDGDCGGGRGS